MKGQRALHAVRNKYFVKVENFDTGTTNKINCVACVEANECSALENVQRI
jgi:hypothetical protein